MAIKTSNIALSHVLIYRVDVNGSIWSASFLEQIFFFLFSVLEAQVNVPFHFC